MLSVFKKLRILNDLKEKKRKKILRDVISITYRYNYSRNIALHDWFLMRDMSVNLLNPINNYWTAFYYRGTKRRDCRMSDAVLHAKYHSYTISIYNPLWSPNQVSIKLFPELLI